jgi:hypothetical protein
MGALLFGAKADKHQINPFSHIKHVLGSFNNVKCSRSIVFPIRFCYIVYKIDLMKKVILLLILFGQYSVSTAQIRRQVSRLKITIRSTMLAQDGIGDWGFGALIECDSNRILLLIIC